MDAPLVLDLVLTFFQVVYGLLLGLFYMFYNFVRHYCLPEHFHKDIRGQVVLITGGGSGIGRLVANKLAKLGAIVVSWDVNQAGNEETVKCIVEEGGRGHAYTVDVGNKEQVYATAKRVEADVGKVDILINNAGIVAGNKLLDIPDEKVELTFKVNILAHFWTLKAFLPSMLEDRAVGGHVVNVASLAGHGGVPRLSDYCSSKFAAVGLDEALRVELGHSGMGQRVKCTAVCPFFINTGMFDGVTRSKLFSILDPVFVADKIVQGILLEKDYVYLPGWFLILLILKPILPVPAAAYLFDVLGFTSAMDSFKGRTVQKQD